MNSIIQELTSLGFSPDSIVSLFSLFVLYILFVRKFDKNDNQIELIKKDISHIKENLSNHITDTNKKIDKLEDGQITIKREFKSDFKELRQEFKSDFKELKQDLTIKMDTGHKELKELIAKSLKR